MQEQRNLIKKDVADNSRLHFLQLFMASQRLNYNDVGRILNITKSAVCHMFASVDDAKLSVAFKLARAMNFDLNIILTRDGDECADAIKINVDEYLHLPSGYKPDDLTFLSLALKRYGITKKSLSEKMGIHPTSLQRMFRIRDLSVARLLQIASVCEFDIRFEFVHNCDYTREMGMLKKKTGYVRVVTTLENGDAALIPVSSKKPAAKGVCDE